MNTIFRDLVISLITVYQKTISPDHGIFRNQYPYGFCKYFPTCSEYTKQAILKFGLVKGCWLGFTRVVSCNPLTSPKIDNLPNKF